MDYVRIRAFKGFGEVGKYGQIPIAYEVRERLDLAELALGRLVARASEPYAKDYDAVESERPSALAARYDVSEWWMLLASEGAEAVGGAIVAPTGYDLGIGTAALVDLRVTPASRGSGICRRLVRAALELAHPLGVETQDVNVAACRLYASMGGRVVEIAPGAYGANIDEARIVWRLDSVNEG